MTDASDLPNDPELAEPQPDLAEALLARDTEIADLKDRLLRTAAEMENTRRRLDRERVDAAQYAMTGFARDLLGVADNLRRAVAALPGAGDSEPVDKVRGGIEATERELQAVLARHGITRVDTAGTKLDPNRHQAMIEVDSDEHQAGDIVAELQAGYTIKDRLLRPALVSVAKSKGEA